MIEQRPPATRATIWSRIIRLALLVLLLVSFVPTSQPAGHGADFAHADLDNAVHVVTTQSTSSLDGGITAPSAGAAIAANNDSCQGVDWNRFFCPLLG
ncbi:MAG TPA: hypothetical protein VER55_10310 [Ardenticatenaceae bacterium]|nr:hypothetical protein [Ardenticatenaceae bacterium]